MADSDQTKAEASAEKAYAAASEAIVEKAVPHSETELSAEPVEFKPKRERKPQPADAAADLTPLVEIEAAAAPSPLVEPSPKPSRLRAPASKVIRATKSVAKPAPKPAIKRAAAQLPSPQPKPAPKSAKPGPGPVKTKAVKTLRSKPTLLAPLPSRALPSSPNSRKFPWT